MNSGAWTTFSKNISERELSIFKQATKNLEGVEYTPIAVSTQVVAGINYKFLCNGKIVYPNTPEIAVIITIYEPLEGPAHITEIKRI